MFERVDWTTVWAVGWCHVPGPEPRERAATPSTRYWRSENGGQDAERSESTLGGPRPPMSIGQDRNSCRNESKRQDWGNWCRAVEGSLGRALLSRRADLHRWLGRSSLRGVTLSGHRRACGSERHRHREHGTKEKGHRREKEKTSPNGAHQGGCYNQTSRKCRSCLVREPIQWSGGDQRPWRRKFLTETKTLVTTSPVS
jgi:hypothetical protein